MAAPNVYRQSYVEKDRFVRNSTGVPVPGVDNLVGFALSKDEFESAYLLAADKVDSRSGAPKPTSMLPSQAAAAAAPKPTPDGRQPLQRTTRLNRAERKERRRKEKAAFKSPVPKPPTGAAPGAPGAAPTPQPTTPQRAFRQRGAGLANPPTFATPESAASYADECRRDGAALQRQQPADYEVAGALFERACDTRARAGLFCSAENADSHVEYAQNLSKRGLTPEAEYHLRCAADIFRMLNARAARKYGDVLLYTAVVVDRQGRLAEAENFYRSALAVYRANKLSDDNVRVAIDSLSNNLRAQGRADEVDTVVQRHFLGAAA